MSSEEVVPTGTESLVSKVSVRVQFPGLRFTLHGELEQVWWTVVPSEAAKANTALLAPDGRVNVWYTVVAMFAAVVTEPEVICDGRNS